MPRRDPLTVDLRPAVPADLAAVAAVFRDCWQGPYAAFLPSRLAHLYDGEAAVHLWRPQLEAPWHGYRVTVAVTDRVVGVVGVRSGDGFLGSLYVDPADQGRGVGRLLFEHARSRCHAVGTGQMRWWVFADNLAGRRFYEGFGATATGLARVEPDYGIPEVEMAVDT